MRQEQEQENTSVSQNPCDQIAHATERCFVDKEGKLVLETEFETRLNIHGVELEIKFSWNGCR